MERDGEREGEKGRERVRGKETERGTGQRVRTFQDTLLYNSVHADRSVSVLNANPQAAIHAPTSPIQPILY